MTTPIRPINPAFAVAGQLSLQDIAAIAAQGYATLINNRPDGEGGPDQPLSRDIEAAAKAAGLHYVFLPVLPNAITADQVAAMRQTLADAPAPVLAFCRSGARSTGLYQLAISS